MQLTDPTVRAAPPRYFGPADVLQQDADGEYVKVRLLDGWDSPDCWARLALGSQPRPSVGDRVLVAGESPDERYVIGCLRPARPPRDRLALSCGVYAEKVGRAEGGELIRVMSARDELLFELDPATGSTRLAWPAGRLELAARGGDLVLRSSSTIRLEGDAVELRGARSIGLQVVRAGAAAASTLLRLLPERLQLVGERVGIAARQAQLQAAQSTIQGETLAAEADVVQLKARKLESVVETLIERAGNVYRSARELAQLQAGRLRTYVSGLSHFRSRRAYFGSEESFHINGDKIHLG